MLAASSLILASPSLSSSSLSSYSPYPTSVASLAETINLCRSTSNGGVNGGHRPLTCLAFTTHHLPGLIHSLQIPLPPPDTKLSVFRQTLSAHTHLPANAFKLIYAGAVMKDDNAPRESFQPIQRTSPVIFSRSTSDPVMFPHSATPPSPFHCRPTVVPNLILRHIKIPPYSSIHNFPMCLAFSP